MDKASAEVYKWALQTPAGASMETQASSYIAHTSDMGVEIGLPDVQFDGPVHSLLPAWMVPEVLPPDVEVEVPDPVDLDDGPLLDEGGEEVAHGASSSTEGRSSCQLPCQSLAFNTS